MPLRKRMILCSLSAFSVGLMVPCIVKSMGDANFLLLAVDLIVGSLSAMIVFHHITEV